MNPDEVRLVRARFLRLDRLVQARGVSGRDLLERAHAIQPPLPASALRDLETVVSLRLEVVEGRPLSASEVMRYCEAAVHAERALTDAAAVVFMSAGRRTEVRGVTP